MIYSTRTTCRLCSGSFKDVVSLGDIHLSTFLDTNENDPPKAPIDLVQCIDCGLVQLRHTVSAEAMYTDYWYQSGLNQSMVKALSDVVQRVKERKNITEDSVLVDIGANDGTLLKNYEIGTTVAFEPNKLIELARPHCNVAIHDFFNAPAYRDTNLPKADVITAIAMFYDLEYPHEFVHDLQDVLADDGIIVIQMMDLLSMVKYNDFPNLCHEHLEYYSLRVFNSLMEQHNLRIFDLEYNGVNGGSLRAYICHKDDLSHPTTAAVWQARSDENTFFRALDLGEFFGAKVEEVKTKIVGYIHRANTEGRKVAVLGASTKGNTVLQYFNLTESDIIHAAEVNPDKYGRRTVGSNIPIIPQAESLALTPDYYLVLPWGFINFFVEKFDDYLRSGGKFIVPLPEPRIIYCNSAGDIVECLIP